MSYRAFLLALLSLTLSGCAVYDYDYDDYRGRYYGGSDYRVYRHYDAPRSDYYIADERRYGTHRYYDKRSKYHNQPYYNPPRHKPPYQYRHDRRYDDRDHNYRYDRRYQPRYDNYQERRHDYTPRLKSWGQNNPGHYQVQPGYKARPHNNPMRHDRSDWSQRNRY